MKFYRDINTFEPLSSEWFPTEEMQGWNLSHDDAIDYTRTKILTEIKTWIKRHTTNFQIYGVVMRDDWGNRINGMIIELDDTTAVLFKLTWC